MSLALRKSRTGRSRWRRQRLAQAERVGLLERIRRSAKAYVDLSSVMNEITDIGRLQRSAAPGRCHSCNRAETPEWRRGPDGARTLCNACGLRMGFSLSVFQVPSADRYIQTTPRSLARWVTRPPRWAAPPTSGLKPLVAHLEHCLYCWPFIRLPSRPGTPDDIVYVNHVVNRLSFSAATQDWKRDAHLEGFTT